MMCMKNRRDHSDILTFRLILELNNNWEEYNVDLYFTRS